jgi:hypothetical protein
LEIGAATGAAQVDANVLRINRSVTGQYATFSSASGAATINGVNGSGGSIVFQGDGNPRAQIDGSGRLLVGTSTARSNINHRGSVGTTPNVQFETATASYSGGLSIINNSTSGFAATLTLGVSKGAGIGSNTIVGNNEQTGTISFSASDGTYFIDCAQIRAEVDGTPGANDMPGRLVFSTTADGGSSPTERMRITNDGTIRLPWGTPRIMSVFDNDYRQGIQFNAASRIANFFSTSNDTGGHITFSTRQGAGASDTDYGTERMRISNGGLIQTFATAGDAIVGATGSAAGTTFTVFGLNNAATNTTNGTTCFRVFTNGNTQNTNNSYAGISDIKLKENIIDANSQWDDLKALQVRKYNFKEETGHQTHTQIGLVAQEVELVSPGLVNESPDRDDEGNDLGTVTKSVNYSVLYMKAVKALQEAMERIEQLETSNTDLLARVIALETA